MSELRVDSVKSKGGGAPDLPKGVTISGITTAATLGATTIDVSNVNVSGVVTSGTLSGPLLSTGTPTLGLGVTINSSGLVVTGVATAGIVSATTLYGDGSNLTGVGATIAPLFYNPDTSDSSVSFGTGIGITFNQQIKAGTGNITIREGSSSGTVVENFGVGSSVTISENRVTFTPSSELSEGVVYHLSYPSGCFTNNEGSDYVGTAYTFKALGYNRQLWSWGYNAHGQLGNNTNATPNNNGISSPVQVAGTTWSKLTSTASDSGNGGVKTDGTLWLWGNNGSGELGDISNVSKSSPVQIPGTTWGEFSKSYSRTMAVKTDGTLWVWGSNSYGCLGQNQGPASFGNQSSPIQIPGTWSTARAAVISGSSCVFGVKSDGTGWAWGQNDEGQLGHNNKTHYSSPVQIPGTTWKAFGAANKTTTAVKTDGTLWAWGKNEYGDLGLNDRTNYSSPKQIPGTIWSHVSTSTNTMSFASRTDGTLFAWGKGYNGQLGINGSNPGGTRSSPTQIPGTTWTDQFVSNNGARAIKSDGTLWGWGRSGSGSFAQGNNQEYSSPVQLASDVSDWTIIGGFYNGTAAIKQTTS